MKLNEFASKIVAENSFIKASFGGFAGSGKTRTATELLIGVYNEMKLKKPVLLIDNEKGSRFLIPLFENNKIPVIVKETVELADILTAFEFLKNNEIDFLFIDSLTKIWYNFVRQYREKNKRVFMTLQDWGKILPQWQEIFADKYVNVEGNCIFTGRGGYTYEMEENEETHKKEFVKAGIKMKMAGETPFETDLNVWMSISQDIDDNNKPIVWREAFILKDRSGLIDGKTFKNPTFKDFKPVINYLMTTPKGILIKESNLTNLTQSEEYQGEYKEREIFLEKIKNELVKREFGTGKEEKAMAVKILEGIFGTSSWTELEKYKAKNLSIMYDKMLSFMVDFDQTQIDKKDFINNYKF